MHSDNRAVFCQLTQCLLIQLQLPILTQFSQRKGGKNWASVCLKPPPQNRVTITWIASEVIFIIISKNSTQSKISCSVLSSADLKYSWRCFYIVELPRVVWRVRRPIRSWRWVQSRLHRSLLSVLSVLCYSLVPCQCSCRPFEVWPVLLLAIFRVPAHDQKLENFWSVTCLLPVPVTILGFTCRCLAFWPY